MKIYRKILIVVWFLKKLRRRVKPVLFVGLFSLFIMEYAFYAFKLFSFLYACNYFSFLYYSPTI